MNDLDVGHDPDSAGTDRCELALAHRRLIEAAQAAGDQKRHNVAARILGIGGLGRQAAGAERCDQLRPDSRAGARRGLAADGIAGQPAHALADPRGETGIVENGVGRGIDFADGDQHGLWQRSRPAGRAAAAGGEQRSEKRDSCDRGGAHHAVLFLRLSFFPASTPCCHRPIAPAGRTRCQRTRAPDPKAFRRFFRLAPICGRAAAPGAARAAP